MNPRTSIIVVGLGYNLIALILASSIRIYPSEILKSRKTVFIT
jgi:hypothetical protein